MVGQTTEQNQSGVEAGAFDPVPTRIQELPELIVDPATAEIRSQMNETLVDLGTRLAIIHMTAAEAYLSQGMFNEAIPHVDAAVGMDRQNTANLNQLGYVRYLSGDDRGAADAFQEVLGVTPGDADALYNLGMIAFTNSDLGRAEACFSDCAQVDPRNAEVWNNLGVVLFQQGKAAEARNCFQQSLAVEPGNEDAQANLRDMG